MVDIVPLLEAIQEFDIITNPHPAALFEIGPDGFQIWCTPEDHPGGLWSKIKMDATGYSKPCEFVALVRWQWSEEEPPTVVGILLKTVAYVLHEEKLVTLDTSYNRPSDVAWAQQKLAWLWQASTAPDPMPPIIIDTG